MKENEQAEEARCSHRFEAIFQDVFDGDVTPSQRVVERALWNGNGARDVHVEALLGHLLERPTTQHAQHAFLTRTSSIIYSRKDLRHTIST